MSMWRKGLCVDKRDIANLTLARSFFFCFLSDVVRAVIKLGRKTSSKDRGVVYQSNRKGLLYKTGHSLGVLGRAMNYLTINHYQVSFSPKKCHKSTLRRLGVNLVRYTKK